jgi:hypothetical protein
LWWGGLAGILGGILFIVVFAVVIAFVGADPAEPEAYPDIRVARTIENSLYLVVFVLWVTHFLALYRALRGTSLAPALFGSGLGIVGLGVLAAGALPHVATARISDLYHAPGTSPEDQANLALAFEAIQGIFESLLIVGLFIVPIGIIVLGMAMLGSPAFGKGFGWASVVLGVAGGVAACVLLVDPASPIAVVGVFALIVFNIVVGWKVYRLSRKGVSKIEGTAGTLKASPVR